MGRRWKLHREPPLPRGSRFRVGNLSTGLVVTNTNHRCGTVPGSHRTSLDSLHSAQPNDRKIALRCLCSTAVGEVTLLIGGVRSGKSALAVEIGRRHAGEVLFIATAEPFDDDMRARISRHRDDRPDWPTIESPVQLGAAIAAAPAEPLLVIDCLTVWVANELHHDGVADADAVATALVARQGPSVVVTNEVGLGVHPETALGRDYRDELGRVNQVIAAVATTTLLMVAGKALRLADPWKELS